MFAHFPDILCPLPLALPFINLLVAETPFYSCIWDDSQVPAFPFSESSDWSQLCSKPKSGPGALLYPLVNPSFPTAPKTLSLQSVCSLFRPSTRATSQVPWCSPGQHNLLWFTQNFLKLLVSWQSPFLGFDYCLFPSVCMCSGWALPPERDSQQLSATPAEMNCQNW